MRSIWAVAINTLRQALRMKIAVVFTLLLLIFLPAFGYTVSGDGTLTGKLQTFISYGLSLVSLLLCLLTIVASVYTLSNDLTEKQIFTVLTKPLRRYQLLLGKLFGILMLDFILMIVFGAIIYIIAVSMPKFSESTEFEKFVADNAFFTARASLKPKEPDVTKEVKALFERRRKNGQLPQAVLENPEAQRNYLKRLTKQVKLSKRSVPTGGAILWQFEKVKPLSEDDKLFIRFKYDVSRNPHDLQVTGQWFVGDNRQYGRDIKTHYENIERRDVIRTPQEIAVSADVIAEDGYLAVAFRNDPRANDTVVIFPPVDGLEVLYKADSFTANFIKALIMIYLRLVFLSCLGILSATFLSFPIAILLCLLVFSTGSISGFIIESFDFIGETMGNIYSYTVKPLIQMLPQFDKVNPNTYLVPARLLSWSFLSSVFAIMVCIKSVIIMIFALIIFSFREVGRVIV